ncbi:hypothetical protein HAH_4421 [Haloarcula hispanica ATCC 33960]|uniref:Uncharacterized protein n=1 Tax=Haloarcula hispanica (strain ATCC 33960 / DSM 4426 / JCM 8911 / NBRC 102182 / NCIMB 2187 / VKM B-1755) TaxID=634497 RepID=G0HZ41_HALHT|nr:hypothetical protein HAH_4421 [Haloarcula hispanica ATCC 33960]
MSVPVEIVVPLSANRTDSFAAIVRMDLGGIRAEWSSAQ